MIAVDYTVLPGRAEAFVALMARMESARPA